MDTQISSTSMLDSTELSVAEPQSAAPTPLSLKENGPAGGKPQILDDVVIEEVSIDGMCGVY